MASIIFAADALIQGCKVRRDNADFGAEAFLKITQNGLEKCNADYSGTHSFGIYKFSLEDVHANDWVVAD